METATTLPKFHEPPLIEVVHGVNFARLPDMTIIHPGLWYLCVKDLYPRSQTAPPLPPMGSPPGIPPVILVSPNELPRAWFISDDDTTLVQTQNDRLLLNWRRGSNNSEYPHFEDVSAKFEQVFSRFESFVAEAGLGPISIHSCGLSYVSQFRPGSIGTEPGKISDLFKVWQDCLEPKSALTATNLRFHASYNLPAGDGVAVGAMAATLNVVNIPGETRPGLQLDISANGLPEELTLTGVLAFHRAVRAHIVTYFASITTEQAHMAWGRYQ